MKNYTFSFFSFNKGCHCHIQKPTIYRGGNQPATHPVPPRNSYGAARRCCRCVKAAATTTTAPVNCTRCRVLFYSIHRRCFSASASCTIQSLVGFSHPVQTYLDNRRICVCMTQDGSRGSKGISRRQ